MVHVGCMFQVLEFQQCHRRIHSSAFPHRLIDYYCSFRIHSVVTAAAAAAVLA